LLWHVTCVCNLSLFTFCCEYNCRVSMSLFYLGHTALFVCCTSVPARSEAVRKWNKQARMWLGQGGTWKRGKCVLFLIQNMLNLIINFLTIIFNKCSNYLDLSLFLLFMVHNFFLSFVPKIIVLHFERGWVIISTSRIQFSCKVSTMLFSPN